MHFHMFLFFYFPTDSVVLLQLSSSLFPEGWTQQQAELCPPTAASPKEMGKQWAHCHLLLWMSEHAAVKLAVNWRQQLRGHTAPLTTQSGTAAARASWHLRQHPEILMNLHTYPHTQAYSHTYVHSHGKHFNMFNWNLVRGGILGKGYKEPLISYINCSPVWRKN